MDAIEISGRTVEEAVEAAAHELGVTVDRVAYEVVEEGAKGFLGLGQTPTLVKAWVAEGEAGEVGTRAGAVERPEAEAEVEVAAEAEAEPEARAEVTAEAPAAESGPEPAQVPEVAAEAFAGDVMNMLQDIVGAMDIDAKPVLKSETEEQVEINLVGDDVGILIGKQGQTLDALQYLISIGANKAREPRKRVILDAEGYRDRHAEMLERRAHEYAKAVKEQQQEAVLEPQSARDRRIVHLALADDPDVYTYSEGMGEDRHVVISPKK